MAKRKQTARQSARQSAGEPTGDAAVGAGALAARLSALGFQAPTAESGAPAGVAATPAPGPDILGGKVGVRQERKGRGGRTVTLVTGLRGDDDALAAFAKRLRKALGCGASVDGKAIVLQGDLRERVKNQLTTWGATKVVLGN